MTVTFNPFDPAVLEHPYPHYEALRVGDPVHQSPCANRDDGHFPESATFDVTRPNARTNLAFGQGPHFCVGASLARAEGRIAFETLLERLDDIALAPEPAPARELSMVLRGLSALHLTFTARDAD